MCAGPEWGCCRQAVCGRSESLLSSKAFLILWRVSPLEFLLIGLRRWRFSDRLESKKPLVKGLKSRIQALEGKGFNFVGF